MYILLSLKVGKIDEIFQGNRNFYGDLAKWENIQDI